jgi:2-C-methyl-D-erythritol 2,4-cyclodiphosphate synthase
MLAGVHVPSDLGSVGHSDADVVLHAISDAILGALALGDIGEWFPDTDPAYKDADSSFLLRTVVSEAVRTGATLVNVDVTVYLEKPKLGPLKAKMRERLAEITGIPVSNIGLKARTFEGFGAVGQSQAVAATAVVLLDSRDSASAGGAAPLSAIE